MEAEMVREFSRKKFASESRSTSRTCPQRPERRVFLSAVVSVAMVSGWSPAFTLGLRVASRSSKYRVANDRNSSKPR
jgi:hypothetical protein